MGQFDRHDFYRSFIACNQEVSDAKAEALTTVRTSCAMFVRAIRGWCGAPPAGPYVPGTGMFVSMGNVSFSHPAFVPNNGSSKPNRGDNFYIAPSQQSNDGHTGIFVEEISDGRWRTAEGGGGGKQDGTLCRLSNERRRKSSTMMPARSGLVRRHEGRLARVVSCDAGNERSAPSDGNPDVAASRASPMTWSRS
jgi:hypothetical protein